MNNNEVKESEETVTVVNIKKFKLRPEDGGELPITIPKHFLNGGFYIAVKHMSEGQTVYRVFFNKINSRTTKKNFFEEIDKAEIAGLFIDPDDKDNYMWEVELEEFDFTKIDEYNVSEKALYFMSDIMLMPIDKFKKLAKEDQKDITIKNPLTGESSTRRYDLEADPQFLAMDEAIMDLQAHILHSYNDKYENGITNPSGDIIWSAEHGKGANMFNAMKYLSRYLNNKGNKANNYEDLMKAAHFILFEMARRNIFK